ncbi:MAG: hypothetical protein M1365_00060 [Actinobacteria bacterium]|nr:hypothetical protein [Actinomycetota bacterium]
MSEIVFNAPKPKKAPQTDLETQVENLQTTLASLNQQIIILQETLQERDQKIAELEMRLANGIESALPRIDNTLTIVGLFINLYQLITRPREDSAV